ncbi:hypothetical protein CAL20_22890 [Bordetella genomosp. 4]|uniref:HTH lacI-type domain-containing protein n=2 Tax=Bordetella genomosp. 4 TaxID=463044 RepID=A0A261TM00_9BORD|nr:hypothetical protein CAL20_22890 [Bordetella genomosp. 4]
MLPVTVTGNIGRSVGSTFDLAPSVETMTQHNKSDTKETPRAARRKTGTYTIHDVANMAGVSSITVSRYFNSPDKVSAALRERLKEIVDSIGYVPSQVAGGLASGRGRVVCAVMQNIASTTFADLVKGMTDELQSSGLQLLLANAQYSKEQEEQAIRTFVGWHPSALILTRDDHTPASETILRGLNIPIVEAWGFVPQRPFHQVGFPHAEVGAVLAGHFLDQGCQRIQFVLPMASEDFRAKQRADGYASQMRKAGFKPDIQVATHADDFDVGEKWIESFAKAPKRSRPEAVIFSNDNMAAGAILHAPACGVALPRDCLMAGFGDAAISARLTPALTTVRPPRYQIGQHAARAILKLLNAEGENPADLVRDEFESELIVRESSRRR